MAQPLPRYNASTHQAEDTRKLNRILEETGLHTTPTTASTATLPGDNRRLRGIPTVARGVSGVSPGTDPLGALIAKESLQTRRHQ